MKKSNLPPLTASEIANLWISYQNDTMSKHMINYLSIHTEDRDIRSVLDYALSLANEHVIDVTKILKHENYPIPIGFTKKDTNPDAPRLFSDKLCLHYMVDMGEFALPAYGIALSVVAREDVMSYYSKCLDETKQLYNQSKRLMIKKGFYIRDPVLPTPDGVDFVHRQNFLAGWFDVRPLLGIEIADLVYNAKRTALAQALVTGFAQCAQSKDVQYFLERCRKLSGKHFNIFSNILRSEDLSSSINLASEVTTSTISPFSDKLIMYHVATFIATGVAQYGFAMSSSPRRDLGFTYTRLMAETALLAEDGANILIDHGWMEQPPESADRKKLIKE